MAKKEKKVKAQKQPGQKKQKKQAELIPEHQRPLICPPDQAGRGLGTRVFGYICRLFVVMCLTWALMMFFGGGFTGSYDFGVCVSEGKMLLLAAFATAVFGLLFYNRFTALGGVALGAAGFALLSPNVVQGVLALYNGFLCRLYLSKFTMYLTNIGIDVPNLTSGDSLAAYYLEKLTAHGADGMLVMALVLSAIFVPLLAKRTRPVLPTVAILLFVVPVCVFNVASSGLGAGVLIASVAAVLVMWAYDKMFRRRVNADQYDTKMQLFVEQDKPEYPEEYLQKKREKAEKKQQKKLAKAAKKQQKRKGKTVDQEISDYLAKPQKKAKPKKQRLTEQEKKQLKLQKKQQKLHKKEIKKQVLAARKYERETDSARSAMGGFAAAMMLAVCLLIVIIPALSIKKHMIIKVLDEKIAYARAYVTAALMGDDERLDELEYELDQENFKPHSTQLEHVQFDGTQIFYIESQYAANLYLRGWIGVEYHDGAWYPAGSSDDEENPGAFDAYRDLWDIDEHPSDQMFYDFYWLQHPDLQIFDPSYDFVKKYHKYADYGFVAMTVHMRRVNSYDSLLYLPSVFDQSRGLYGYGNAEKSEHSFVNYYDGILTGRDFTKAGTKYSALTFAPIKTDKDWIDILGTDIADYNLQKELILAFSSYKVEQLSYGQDVKTNYVAKVEKDVPEKGVTTVTYRKGTNVIATFIHRNEDVHYSSDDKLLVLRDGAENEYRIELDSNFRVKSVTTENTESLLHRYISGSEDDRTEIARVLFGGTLKNQEEHTNYTDYVYKYYTDKSGSQIIADLADEIFQNATFKEKVQIGTEHIEAVTHEEYRKVETVSDIDWSTPEAYFTEQIIVDENGVESVEYVPVDALTEEMVWAGLVYTIVTVVDEEAYDAPIYETIEHPYDFTAAALPNATFDAAVLHRNDLVRAVIDYIIDEKGCSYTLTPNLDLVDDSLDGVENFLTNTQEGYCVQFASAAALILREYGIPTRYVEGYIACDFGSNHEKNSVGRFATYVHDYEAHAWIEVFFDGIGWVQYECTPAYYEGMYGGAQSNPNDDSSSSTPPPSIKDQIDDMIDKYDPEAEEEEKLDEEALAEAEQRRRTIIASIVFVSVAAVAAAVIAVLVHLKNRAASAQFKRDSAAETVLSEHFGQNTSEDDRRELSFTVIDALHNLLDIYGLSPEPGEFKDEYAQRIAIDLEDLLGRSPEYEQAPDPEQEIDPNAPAPAPLPVSPHRMGQIMDAIAAEEFGHGMSVAQMKQVSALYCDLRASVHKRVRLGRRIVLRYIKNRL